MKNLSKCLVLMNYFLKKKNFAIWFFFYLQFWNIDVICNLISTSFIRVDIVEYESSQRRSFCFKTISIEKQILLKTRNFQLSRWLRFERFMSTHWRCLYWKKLINLLCQTRSVFAAICSRQFVFKFLFFFWIAKFILNVNSVNIEMWFDNWFIFERMWQCNKTRRKKLIMNTKSMMLKNFRNFHVIEFADKISSKINVQTKSIK